MEDKEIREIIQDSIRKHMINDHAHSVANENRNGFMSSEHVKAINEIKDTLYEYSIKNENLIENKCKSQSVEEKNIIERKLYTNLSLDNIDSENTILKINFNKDNDISIYPELNKLGLPLSYKRSPFGRMVNCCNNPLSQSLLIDLKENLGIFNLSFILDTYNIYNNERETSTLSFVSENKDFEIYLAMSNSNILHINYKKILNASKYIKIDNDLVKKISTGHRYKAVSLIKKDSLLSLYVDGELISQTEDLLLMTPIRYFYCIDCPSICNLTITRNTDPYIIDKDIINIHEYFGNKEYSTVKMNVKAVKYKGNDKFTFDRNTDIDIIPITNDNQTATGLIITTGSHIKNSIYVDEDDYLNDGENDTWQDNVKPNTIFNTVIDGKIYKSFKGNSIVDKSRLINTEFKKGNLIGLADMFIPLNIKVIQGFQIDIQNIRFDRINNQYRVKFATPISLSEEIIVYIDYTEIIEKNKYINKGEIIKAILNDNIEMEVVKSIDIDINDLNIERNGSVLLLDKTRPLLMENDNIDLYFSVDLPKEFMNLSKYPQLSKYIKVQIMMKLCTDKDNQIIETNNKCKFNMKAGAVTLKDYMIYDEKSELFTYNIKTKNKLLLAKIEVKVIFDCDKVFINKENSYISDMICYKDGLLDIMSDKQVELTYMEEGE